MAKPRGSRTVSGKPSSPATVEKRMTMSVRLPLVNMSALVYWLTSSVASKTPHAPPPFACTTRSGTRSRLNCAVFWIR